jgi:hypothetical protein
MKSLRRLCAAGALTLAFTICALAGEITTGITTPPPPPPADGEIGTGAPGQIDTPAGEADFADPAMQAALSLLQTALSLP